MGVARFTENRGEAQFSGPAVLHPESGTIVASLNSQNEISAQRVLGETIYAALSNSAGTFEGTPFERGMLIDAIRIIAVLLIIDIRRLHDDPLKIQARVAFRL